MADLNTFDCACCEKSATAANLGACNSCHLVHYCTRACQLKHWPVHKQACKSPLMEDTWQPEWVHSNRTPAFIGGTSYGVDVEVFGGKKYFWGNVPAIDVLQLRANEGEDYSHDLDLLFAASGDIRNVVKTLAAIPDSYSNSVSVALNDRDLDIVARNAIMLLIVCVESDEAVAVDCMLHMWFSSMIRQKHLELITTKVLPLIEDVVKKVAGKAANTIQRKTWKFDSITVRLALPKETWSLLLSYFKVPPGLVSEEAQRIRTAVTMARKDHRERNFVAQAPAHRVCKERFRIDGILLPFGHSKEAFTTPNPTFFQTASWPMSDAADPIDGWDWNEVVKTNSGFATNDLYGKLSLYVKRLLHSFYGAMRKYNCEFSLFNMDAASLPEHLGDRKFARIEVSNIADGGYLGIAKTLIYLGPLLQTPDRNPHATFITLFMNAVTEMVAMKPQEYQKGIKKELDRVNQYMPIASMRAPRTVYDPQIILRGDAVVLFRDSDKYFEMYKRAHKFDELGDYLDMKMKVHHTIVEQWPMRLKLLRHQPGAMEEFKTLQASSHTGLERYVEWRKSA